MSGAAVATALAGGVVIAAGASLLLLLHGRLAGVGGIVAGLRSPGAGESGWRAAFVAGLIVGGLAFAWLHPVVFGVGQTTRPLPLIAVAGAAVGFGTRLGRGCTSGHGICGISRLSKRGIVATATFMLTRALAATLAGLLGSVR